MLAFKQLFNVFNYVEKNRRYKFLILLILIILSAFAEIVSIGSILPFLGALTSPDYIFEHPSAQVFIKYLNLSKPSEILLPVTIFFIIAIIFSGFIRLALLYLMANITHVIGADLSAKLYLSALYLPYADHVSKNSSRDIDEITIKANIVVGNMGDLIVLISSSFLLISIVSVLMYIDFFASLVIFTGFGASYFLIIVLNRRILMNSGEIIARESPNVIKALQEGFGGIRDVILDKTQSIFCEIFSKSDWPVRHARARIEFASASPRYLLETFGMLLIAIVAYILTQSPNGIIETIPVLGAIALGSQRLLPALQQMYYAWAGIISGQHSLHEVLVLLNRSDSLVQISSCNSANFSKEISVHGLSFKYLYNSPLILDDINFSVKKGEFIGFIGSTGSGKSTFLDVLMGLLNATSGFIRVDGVKITSENIADWQMLIAHVPQFVYLSDSTIAENIAFGVPVDEIDDKRVLEAAQNAQIADVIESWDEQYETKVGEGGVRISGGQRQRIGIARALYKKAQIIVLDEATSALDNLTERSVMNAIEALSGNVTVFIVAHRLSTLSKCSKIIEIEEGRVVKISSYADVMLNNVI